MGLGMARTVGQRGWPDEHRATEALSLLFGILSRGGSGAGHGPDRWRSLMLAAPIRFSPLGAVAAVMVQLVACTAITWGLGGAGPVPPHVFYIPVLFAGIRWGPVGAAVTGIVSGLATGPFMPLDVSAGTAQPLSDWASRMGFFAGIGGVATFVFQQNVVGLRREADDLRAEHELLAAVRAGQLRVHYQPIVSLDTGRIVGAEALVRWQHPERGMLPPADFLPFARERGLLGYIRQAVLSEACRHTAYWCRSIESLYPEFRISVNLDAGELTNPMLLEEVAGALVANRLEPSRLCLEITETGLIEDLEQSVESLLALRLLRVGIAVDDFGTGYASLEYAQTLPVDEIKIDRTFVSKLGRDPRATAVTQSVVDLAQKMDRSTVAEGVETADQLVELIAIGCRQAQGFYFSEPLSSRALTDLLRSAPTWPNRGVFTQAPSV
jgi:EAL domain-containing protein (putative c-di-GMP-specific phosphodiesterase class I)